MSVNVVLNKALRIRIFFITDKTLPLPEITKLIE